MFSCNETPSAMDVFTSLSEKKKFSNHLGARTLGTRRRIFPPISKRLKKLFFSSATSREAPNVPFMPTSKISPPLKIFLLIREVPSDHARKDTSDCH